MQDQYEVKQVFQGIQLQKNSNVTLTNIKQNEFYRIKTQPISLTLIQQQLNQLKTEEIISFNQLPQASQSNEQNENLQSRYQFVMISRRKMTKQQNKLLQLKKQLQSVNQNQKPNKNLLYIYGRFFKNMKRIYKIRWVDQLGITLNQFYVQSQGIINFTVYACSPTQIIFVCSLITGFTRVYKYNLKIGKASQQLILQFFETRHNRKQYYLNYQQEYIQQKKRTNIVFFPSSINICAVIPSRSNIFDYVKLQNYVKDQGQSTQLNKVYQANHEQLTIQLTSLEDFVFGRGNLKSMLIWFPKIITKKKIFFNFTIFSASLSIKGGQQHELNNSLINNRIIVAKPVSYSESNQQLKFLSVFQLQGRSNTFILCLKAHQQLIFMTHDQDAKITRHIQYGVAGPWLMIIDVDMCMENIIRIMCQNQCVTNNQQNNVRNMIAFYYQCKLNQQQIQKQNQIMNLSQMQSQRQQQNVFFCIDSWIQQKIQVQSVQYQLFNDQFLKNRLVFKNLRKKKGIQKAPRPSHYSQKLNFFFAEINCQFYNTNAWQQYKNHKQNNQKSLQLQSKLKFQYLLEIDHKYMKKDITFATAFIFDCLFQGQGDDDLLFGILGMLGSKIE